MLFVLLIMGDILEKRKVVGCMDFLGIYVDGNLLQTFCNMFLVVFALDFVSTIAQILRMR